MNEPRGSYKTIFGLDDTSHDLWAEEYDSHPGQLFIGVEQEDGKSTCLLVDRDTVLRLHAALGEWLYPVHTPEAPNRNLIEQLIERAAKDAVTAILPLHLAPASICHAKDCDTARHLTAPVCTIPEHQTDRWGYVDAQRAVQPAVCPDCGQTRGEIHQCDTDASAYCRIDGCTFPSIPGAVHFEHDPEPHDVGHPEPGIVMNPNISCTCHDADGNSTLPEATTTGRWEAELRRDAGKSVPLPYCNAKGCGHSWARHTRSGGCSVRTGTTECACREHR